MQSSKSVMPCQGKVGNALREMKKKYCFLSTSLLPMEGCQCGHSTHTGLLRVCQRSSPDLAAQNARPLSAHEKSSRPALLPVKVPQAGLCARAVLPQKQTGCHCRNTPSIFTGAPRPVSCCATQLGAGMFWRAWQDAARPKSALGLTRGWPARPTRQAAQPLQCWAIRQPGPCQKTAKFPGHFGMTSSFHDSANDADTARSAPVGYGRAAVERSAAAAAAGHGAGPAGGRGPACRAGAPAAACPPGAAAAGCVQAHVSSKVISLQHADVCEHSGEASSRCVGGSGRRRRHDGAVHKMRLSHHTPPWLLSYKPTHARR